MKAMIVKQGIECTDAGKGELNSAISGLGSLMGIVGPGMIWGPLFQFFSSAPTRATRRAWWLRWGAGGHYFGCAGLLLAAAALLRCASKGTLHLEEQEDAESPTKDAQH